MSSAQDPFYIVKEEILESLKAFKQKIHDVDTLLMGTMQAKQVMNCLRRQDEELDELSASVQQIGHVGLTIHDELLRQGRIIEELGMEMDSTSNRLEFLQKKVDIVMKKAGAKGQSMMILFLFALFLILFFLVFFT